MHRKVMAVVAAGLLAFASGCSSENMPDRAQIESGYDKIMQQSGLDFESMDEQYMQIYEQTRTCIVDAVEDSGNTELAEAFASGDGDAEGSPETAQQISDIVTQCMK